MESKKGQGTLLLAFVTNVWPCYLLVGNHSPSHFLLVVVVVLVVVLLLAAAVVEDTMWSVELRSSNACQLL